MLSEIGFTLHIACYLACRLTHSALWMIIVLMSDPSYNAAESCTVCLRERCKLAALSDPSYNAAESCTVRLRERCKLAALSDPSYNAAESCTVRLQERCKLATVRYALSAVEHHYSIPENRDHHEY
jgi:hypothetical protein